MSACLEVTTTSPEETQGLGRRLGELALPGDIFLLEGELGSGKTTLTQGIAWGLGVGEHARSPTFVLATEYRGRLPLYHVDLYRVQGGAEAWELGLEEYLFGEGVSVVEWADRALRGLQEDHLWIVLEPGEGEAARNLRLKAHGPRYAALLDELSRPWKAG